MTRPSVSGGSPTAGRSKSVNTDCGSPTAARFRKPGKVCFWSLTRSTASRHGCSRPNWSPSPRVRCFPGFDEPSFRAVFAITITAPTAYEVVSNMPVKTREVQGDTTRWQFAPTPPMPTYLVAVSVGQFDALEDSVDGIPLRILTAKGKKAEALYAMDVTKKVLTLLPRIFRRSLRASQARPDRGPRRSEGAMEDWGFISYNESNLLYNPANSSIETKQGVFELIAHEIAHQWFGNLVTAASWDEIWLNEAFATWIGGQGHDTVQSGLADSAQSGAPRQRVMSGDAGPATRAIRSGPVYETAVFDVFDAVTYTKGGAVLTMIENVRRTRSLPARTLCVFPRAKAVQRHRRRSLALPVTGVRDRRRRRRAKLDRPEGLSAAAGTRELHKGQADAGGRAAAVQRRRQRRQDEPVASAIRGVGWRRGGEWVTAHRAQSEIRNRAVHAVAVVRSTRRPASFASSIRRTICTVWRKHFRSSRRRRASR